MNEAGPCCRRHYDYVYDAESEQGPSTLIHAPGPGRQARRSARPESVEICVRRCIIATAVSLTLPQSKHCSALLDSRSCTRSACSLAPCNRHA